MRNIPFMFYDRHSESSNMYLLKTNEKSGVIIDASFISLEMEETIAKLDLKILGIFLTHGHYDHFLASEYYQNKYSCPIYIHKNDHESLYRPILNCSYFMGKEVVLNGQIETLKNGQEITIDDTTITIIHTPFHTTGSCCFFIKKSRIMFSGDTIFYRSIGRTDLPTSEPWKVTKSLNKLIKLNNKYNDIKVYPGHGKETTLNDEVKHNPFFNE